MKQQLIQYSFLCSSKEKDEKKGRPGKAFILVHWLFFGNFRTHPPTAGSHSLQFFSSKQPLTRGFSGGITETGFLQHSGLISTDRPYTM